jgi:hypothetical protein
MSNQYLSFDSSGENLTASGALNVASIAVAGVTPGNDQYLTTSNVGALAWIAKPTFASNIKALLLFTLPAFNYNANVATTPVSFAASPAFNSLGGDITYNGVDSILVNTTGVYMVQYSPNVASSSSVVNVRVEIGGIVTNISQINASSNNCDCLWLGNVTAAQTIVITSQRSSGAAAKNSIGGTTSSPLTVIRLA